MADSRILGAIIAGGKSQRMGNTAPDFHKGTLLVAGKPVIEWITERAVPQVSQLVINTNRAHAEFQSLNCELLTDEEFVDCGPLAGVLTVMEWAHSQPTDFHWLVTFPADTPFIPANLVETLLRAAEAKHCDIAYSRYGEQTSQLAAVWNLSLRDELARWLQAGERGVIKFIERQQNVCVGFDSLPNDPFFNINTAAQLQQAQKLANDLIRD